MSNEPDDITRREFVSRTATAVAGVALGGAAVARTQSGTVGSRVLGANDRVVLASIGIRGQGNALKRGFARLKNVEIKTICDIDANIGNERINDERSRTCRLSSQATAGPAPRARRQGHRRRRDRDAEPLARAGHHLGAPGGQARLRREAGVAHRLRGPQDGRGRPQYNQIVQVGTMNRSRPAVQQAIEFIHEGGIGKIYMARGLCFKPRPAIGKYPDGPMAAGEKYKLNAESEGVRADLRRAYLVQGRLRPVAGARAPAAVQPQPLPLQLALALGLRQRRHRQPGAAPVRHRALGPPTRTSTPSRSPRGGGFFDDETLAGDAGRPHHDLRVRGREDPRVRAPAASRPTTRAAQKIGNLFYGSKGWVWIDGDGQGLAVLPRPQGREGAGRDGGGRAGQHPNVPTSIEYPHYQNFVDAIRAGDRSKLTAEIEEGHLSASLPHLANIAYQVGRTLTLRHHGREVQGRQGSGRAPDADLSRGLRDQGQGLVRAVRRARVAPSPPVATPRRPGTPRPR